VRTLEESGGLENALIKWGTGLNGGETSSVGARLGDRNDDDNCSSCILGGERKDDCTESYCMGMGTKKGKMSVER